jgi:hypothetical protein
VYDARTRFTNALLFGGLADNRRSHASSHWNQLLQFIIGSLEHSNHPLILPLIVLQDNYDRLQEYCVEELDGRMIEIERQLGVCRTGALADAPADVFLGRKNLQETRNEIQDLTVRMNTEMTEFIFVSGCAVWQKECYEFLIKLSQELSQVLPSERDFVVQSRWIHQEIELFAVSIITLSGFIERLKARMEVQLSTVRIILIDLSCNHLHGY